MCKFFSFVTKGNRKYCMNWEQRLELMKSNPICLEPDSHTSICKFYDLDDDKVNKYEYNPLNQEFTVDQINIKDDRALAERWVKKLDFATIVKPLRLNKIIHPFEIEPPEINDSHLELLKLWTSVRASVWDSVWAYISDFFEIDDWKYIDHKPGENPFNPCIELWKQGIVPSNDGQKWRLHTKNGIAWEGDI